MDCVVESLRCVRCDALGLDKAAASILHHHVITSESLYPAAATVWSIVVVGKQQTATTTTTTTTTYSSDASSPLEGVVDTSSTTKSSYPFACAAWLKSSNITTGRSKVSIVKLLTEPSRILGHTHTTQRYAATTTNNNEPFSGSLRSYGLILMVFAVIRENRLLRAQHRAM